MAKRANIACKINGFWTYKQGWNWTDGSGSSWKYFGKSAATNEDFGPMCISFSIPSSVSNLSSRAPKIKLSFSAYNIISGYGNDATLRYYITTEPRKEGTKSIQGSGESYRKSAINEKSVTITTSSTSVETAEIALINNPKVGTTYYCWFYIADDDVRKYNVRNISATVTYNAYTNCSAPTYVKFEYNGAEKTSPYTHPSDNGTSGVKIIWSGAKAGAGMQIDGYKIQRYDKEKESWNEHDTIVNSSTTSCALAEGKRGEVRTYRIITLGTVSGYDSAASSMVYIYFNSKPTAPGGSNLIVKSTAETAEIPITIPVTNYSYKTNTRSMTLWYSSDGKKTWENSGVKSDSSTKKTYNFQVGQTPEQGKSQDYYFKMKDNFGDESTVLKITLTRSVPLEVSSFTATLTSQSEGEMWVSFYTDTSAHKNSIKIELMSGVESIASIITPWKDSINLLEEGPEYNGSMELTYKFTLNVSDDFGDSASQKAATYLNSGDNVEKDITISALPNDVTLYNTLDGASIKITGVGELRYFDKIRAQFDANTLMTSNATLYIGESTIGYDAKLSTDASALTFSLNRDEILNKLTISALKGRIEFSFSLGTKIKNSFSKTIYFSPRPSISITPPSSTFGMYSQSTGIFQINGNFSGFGLKDISISGGINGIAPLQYKAENLDPPDTNGYKIEGFNLANLFPLTGFNAESRQGTTIQTITLTATNVLGVTRTAEVKVTLDFRKTPSAITIGQIKYGDKLLGNTTKLCERTEIQVPFTYTSYGGDAIRFAVYWNDIEKASTTVTPMEGGKVAGSENVAGKPNNEESLSFTVPPIPFGKETANIVIKANLVNSSAASVPSKITVKVSPYEDPGMNVLSSNLEGNTLILNCSLKTQEIGTYTYKLLLKNEEDSWVEKPTGGIHPNSFILEELPAGNQVARIEIIYTYPNDTTRAGDTIKSYSNTFVIFAASPTVSYRKNYLGINNTTPAEGTVVDINSFAGRNKIKFSSPTEAIIELIASSDGPQLIFTKKADSGDTIYTLTFD